MTMIDLAESMGGRRRRRSEAKVPVVVALPKEAKPTLDLLKDGSLWERKCNGKRYIMVGDVREMFGRKMVWLYEEGVNRCLHLPVETVLKRYRWLDRSQFKVSFQ